MNAASRVTRSTGRDAGRGSTPSRTGRGVRRSVARWVAHLLVGTAATVLVPIALAPSAQAIEPIGGCWIWFDGIPQTDISSSLAPWANPDTEPKGPADHTIALSPAQPAAGSTGTIEYAYNKGPENKGPAAQVQGVFRFSVNGDKEYTATVDFGLIGTNASIPGRELEIPFTVEQGENLVVFEGVTFTAQAFNVKIDCNGQKKGDGETNPRTDPKPTNVKASVTSVGQVPTIPGSPEIPDQSLLCSLLPIALPVLCAEPQPEPDPDPDPEPTDPPTEEPTDGTDGGTGTDAGDKGTGGGAGGGTPAAGTVGFACVLYPFNSAFDWDPDVTVAGAPGGSGTDLLATMTDLPGIAPVPIDGPMEVTLGLDVAGKATTVTGTSQVTAAPNTEVPVPDLTGAVAAAADTMPVTVTSFAFDFPSYEIDADCTPKRGADLGDMSPGGSLSGGGDGGAAAGAGGTSTGGSGAVGVGTTTPTTAGTAVPGLGALTIMDARLEGSTALGELFGAAPQRQLVLIVQNPTTSPVADPTVALGVGRAGVAPEPMDMAMGTIAPGETRRVQVPVSLSSSGFGTYHVVGQLGGTPAGAFSVSWQSQPYGLYLLLLVALLVAGLGARRELASRRTPGAAPGRAASADGEAIVDLSKLEIWWARRPRGPRVRAT